MYMYSKTQNSSHMHASMSPATLPAIYRSPCDLATSAAATVGGAARNGGAGPPTARPYCAVGLECFWGAAWLFHALFAASFGCGGA